jgi:glycosyltransferase involved in cell wall biosynthesis
MKIYFDISAIPDNSISSNGLSRVLIYLITEALIIDPTIIRGISFRKNDLELTQEYKLHTSNNMVEIINMFRGENYLPLSNEINSNEKLNSGDVILCLGEQWLFPNALEVLKRLKEYRNIKILTLIYDLIPYFYPNFYWKNFDITYKNCIEKLVNISDYNLVISKKNELDLIKYIPTINTSKIHRLVLGSDLNYNISNVSNIPFDIYKEKYILCISTLQPRKNHEILFKSWERLINKYSFNCPKLVLVNNNRGWGTNDSIKKNVEKNKFVVLLNEISDLNIIKLYQNCLLTIFPSFYEGWGLPVAESLTLGKLCLASNTSSIPEVGADSAKYFDPTDAFQISKMIEKYLDNPILLKEDELFIKCNYKITSWNECAKNLMKIVGINV